MTMMATFGSLLVTNGMPPLSLVVVGQPLAPAVTAATIQPLPFMCNPQLYRSETKAVKSFSFVPKD